MSKIAFIFPGQASQYSGMGREIHDSHPEAAAVFRRADEVLGFPLSAMCFQGSEDELKLTENTQPAILTVSVAVLQVLRQRGLVPDFVAGHSLGEYSALVAAGGLTFDDAVLAVRKRGRYMQAAVPVGVGAMAACLGMDLATVEAVCAAVREGQVLVPANINCPGQIVVAGHAEPVDRAITYAKKQGLGRMIRLPVSAPFHCELMRPAQEQMAQDLSRIAFGDLAVPLVTNVDARFITAGADARDSLVRQVTGSVRWQASVEGLAAAGADVFVEVGPKTVLSQMVRKISPEARTFAVEKPAEIDTVLAALKTA